MTDKPENPPAFPVRGAIGYNKDGLTMRDYFAAAALPSLCAEEMEKEGGSFDAKKVAEDCYIIADAMLKARQS